MIGRTLSHYKVLEKIGEGGMGEVYLAKDTKLDREVAVKVLPATFSENKERLARFEREARLLASLNHPNIAAIFELEESDGVHFLALEYVPGETLAERIKRGPIPIDEALPLFKQIAEGLEAAHEKGVIHRDLKPANIKVTPEGKVKVLDFGLAKAMAGEAPTQGLSESPTITREHTEAGVLLGTAPYMSPEQARGKAVDKRTDIWAFGCCLYEALTGKAAYLGDTVTDTIAKIVEREPDWDELPTTTPALLSSLLRRCLRKNSTHRLHDIADARIEIEEAKTESIVVGDIRVTTRSQERRAFPWIVAVLAALVAGLTVWYLKPPPPPPVTKTLLEVKPAEMLGVTGPYDVSLSRTAIALSRDGRHLVYSAGDSESSRLYLRPLDELEARPIAGTEGGMGPFFAPDGQWVGFWADGELKRIHIDGGPSVALCESSRAPFGASWGTDDTIVFGQYAGGILAVSADGGEPRTITTLAEGEFSHRLPQFLPDGDWLIFTATKGILDWEGVQVIAYSLETDKRKVLVENGADARYVPTGHIVFARLGTLMAVPFDPTDLEITGGPVGVLDGVKQAVNAANSESDTGAAQFTISASGSLAYLPGGISPDIEDQLVWVDRKGVAEPLPAPPAPYVGPRLSPDGKRIAYWTMSLKSDVWVYDVSRTVATRLPLEEGEHSWPLWTPDGARITFSSNTAGVSNIYRIPADGSGPAEQLTAVGPAWPASWSPDGQVLAFVYGENEDEIWMLPQGKEPRPFIATSFEERHPLFSPDGHWLAYSSNQSGSMEVYVTPYPGPGPKIQISNEGGRRPVWALNGQELFYRTPRDSDGFGTMMVVPIEMEPSFKAGKPTKLFREDYVSCGPNRCYDVSADGQTFLMIRGTVLRREPVTQVHIVLNWFEELKRLVPTN